MKSNDMVSYNGIDIRKSFVARWVTLYDEDGDMIATGDDWQGGDIPAKSWVDLVDMLEQSGNLDSFDVRTLEFQTYIANEVGVELGTLNDYVVDWIEGMPRLSRVIA